MSVGSLVILPVNVVYVLVQEDVVAAALDIAGAQAMVEGEVLNLILSLSLILIIKEDL